MTHDPTLLLYVIFMLTVTAIVLMRDAVKHATCGECPHCKQKIREALQKKEESNHATYHAWNPNNSWNAQLRDCDDPKCPGRKSRGR